MADSVFGSALTDVPIENSRCLEAGAGAGNTSAALLDRDPVVVYAVTNYPDHVRDVQERFDTDPRLDPVLADLRKTPLPADSVDVVTAHALFNLLTPAALDRVVTELSRVTREGGFLVVVDYDPIPDDRVRELFAVENAVAELTDDRPALVFHPRELVERIFTAAGWDCLETGTALEPVPWTGELLDAHVEVIEDHLDRLPDDLAGPLREHTRRVRERAGDGLETGAMYYHIFELNETERS